MVFVFSLSDLLHSFDISDSYNCIFAISVSPTSSLVPVHNQGFMNAYWIKRYSTFTCVDQSPVCILEGGIPASLCATAWGRLRNKARESI